MTKGFKLQHTEVLFQYANRFCT